MNDINLIHGDSLQALKSYGDNHFDWAIVDPPYGIDIANKFAATSGKMGKAARKSTFTHKDWDKNVPDANYFAELKRVSKNQIIWGWNYYVAYLNTCPSYIVWNKKTNGGFADCESDWCSKQGAARVFEYLWNGMLQQNMKDKEIRIHPTQKPVALYKWLLETYTSEGDLILDTHLGSGSIAIASHYMKRNFVGYEIDQEYYENACKRFKEQTAQVALW
jgi:site-specific DNA-methyltransferase (adenine-specific)